MQLPPADVLAAWPKPNYVDPITRGPANTIINIVFFPVVLTIILLRTYTRIFLSNSFGVDDGMILLAMLPTTAFAAINNIAIGLKIEIISQVFFALATTLTKISMLIFVRRIVISSPKKGKMDLATRFAIWLVAVNGILFSLVVIFQCRPPSDYWKLSFEPQPNCVNDRAILLNAGVLNTVTDFLVVLLPLPVVYSLNLSLRQRTLVVMLFAAGFIVCFAGIVRTIFTYIFSRSWDQSWESFLCGYHVQSSFTLPLFVPRSPTKLFFSHYVRKVFGVTIVGSTVPRFTTDDLESKVTARGSVGAGVVLNSVTKSAVTHESGSSENSLVESHDLKEMTP